MIDGNHKRSLSISKAFLIAAVAIAPSPRLDADVVYSYTGNPLTSGMFNSLFTNACSNPECSIEGKFDVAQALAANLSTVTISPVSFSFEFGRGTLAQLELDQTNTSCFINGVQVYPACHNLLRVFPGVQA